MVGNGNSLTTLGLIAELPVNIQGHILHIPVYLLPITGADLVLGAPWLKTLGPHIADYNALSIKFYVKDTFVTLFGEKHKGPIPAQFHHIKRLHNTKAIEASFTLQFQEIHPATGFDPTGLHPDLTAILHSFHDVFAEPQGLPPARFHDHAIPLVQGSNPVKRGGYIKRGIAREKILDYRGGPGICILFVSFKMIEEEVLEAERDERFGTLIGRIERLEEYVKLLVAEFQQSLMAEMKKQGVNQET
ncbi:hypothetical protein KIW84_061301 [Lathyrus oleraceus]|uniref:Uncharacterized protein n=1 Tax=Pisum sativum TaxID=3888 RepID=A0A9D4W5D6_PEA|nr:hypothetical protein KIW84_061301 [Pisum sativum]